MKKIQYILACLLLVLSASCTQDLEMSNGCGYLALEIKTLVSTNTPDGTRADAPADYNPKTLHVKIIDAMGNAVMSTDNYSNDQAFKGNIALEAGTYTVVAHSKGWDGNGSGFGTPYYYGSTTVQVVADNLVTASVECTQANVKVTVNYEKTFTTLFKSAVTTVSSSVSGINALRFIMGENSQSGYFPVGNLTARLDVTNMSNVANSLSKTFENVKARDHYILNFKMAQEGNLGDGTEPGIKVEVDESTNTYTFTFEVPTKSAIALTARAANAWSTFAYLNASVTAKTESFKSTGLTLQWRKSGDTDWTEIPNSQLGIDAKDNISAQVKGLTPNTDYEYRVRYVDGDNEVVSAPIAFTTEEQTALYNGGFEHWWLSGKIQYPNEEGKTYWDTSNPPAAKYIGSITAPTSEKAHGGTTSAKLTSKWAVVKFAAASLYTGEFGELIGTKGAKLKWGTPFNGRPTALKGYLQYEPSAINREGSGLPTGAPAKGQPDQCGLYCALLSEQLLVDNTNMSTFPDWQTDTRVIAYGALPDNENVNSNGRWKEFNIPFVYYDLNRKPTHLLIVCSSSKYGDYFHGSDASVLYLDDFELVYGDNPSVR